MEGFFVLHKIDLFQVFPSTYLEVYCKKHHFVPRYYYLNLRGLLLIITRWGLLQSGGVIGSRLPPLGGWGGRVIESTSPLIGVEVGGYNQQGVY